MAVALISFTVLSAPSRLLNFQGRLADSEGSPLTGARQITFRVYSQSAGGAAVWEETQSVTCDDNGLYSVLLGSVTALSVSFDTDRWLGLQLSGDTEMTPRFQIVGAAYSMYAIEAGHADSADAATNADDADTLDGNDSGAFVTSIAASNGLTGGGSGGALSLTVGQGAGIAVSADAVSFDTTWGDARYAAKSAVVSKVIAGTNIQIDPVGGTGDVTISATGGGGIDGVTAGSGLTGGGTTGTVTIDIGQGTGITVAADTVSLDTTFADNRYLNVGEGNSVTGGMITDGTIQLGDLAFTPLVDPAGGDLEVTGGIDATDDITSDDDLRSRDNTYVDDDLYVGYDDDEVGEIHIEDDTGTEMILLDAKWNPGQAMFRITGTVRVSGTTVHQDYAEYFSVADPSAARPGVVVVIDDRNPGKVRLSAGAYDTKVAGVISGAGDSQAAFVAGGPDASRDGRPLAVAGRVYCFVDANHAAVEVGDLLTTSDTPGYAMKATDSSRSHGAILGKAMQSLASGEKGLILILVCLN